MNKPLVRWTIGKVASVGFETLCESVHKFAVIYPEFRRVICYNQLTHFQIEILQKLPVSLVEQNKAESFFNLNTPCTSGWKLIPARLASAQHELWIDNDIVLVDRIEEIDKWLASDTGVICEGKYRLFGDFEWAVGPKRKICAGLFGLPPYFDFAIKIKELANHLHNRPIKSFDEQGITAAIVSHIPGFILIPRSQIELCEFNLPISAVKGYHFVGVNRTARHTAWESYKHMQSIKLL